MVVKSKITGLYTLFFAIGMVVMFSPDAMAKKKTYICHKGETINISKEAVPAHLRHGDTEGECEEISRPELPEVVIFICAVTDHTIQIANLSSTRPDELIEVGDDCAETNKALVKDNCYREDVVDPTYYQVKCPPADPE